MTVAGLKNFALSCCAFVAVYLALALVVVVLYAALAALGAERLAQAVMGYALMGAALVALVVALYTAQWRRHGRVRS